MNSESSKTYFSAELSAWYRKHKRDLPWRQSRDPYRIWVSEVMLQQTRVDTVIPYYERFMSLFPTIEALAEAPEEEVLKAWEGLGYYSRARNLQTAVREVKERYGSVVPDSKEEMFSLKGVGPYTAGAVLSIAYNKPEPAVDGNVMRVLSRYFLIEEDITKNSTRVQMEKLAAELIPAGEARDFNQAIMELGALVCTPKSPSCLTCPVMKHCTGREAGKEESLPVKKKAKPPRPEQRVAALVLGRGEQAGKVLIRRRPEEGLLAKMWELPHTLTPASEPQLSGNKHAAASPFSISEEEQQRILAAYMEEEGLGIESSIRYMHAEHIFSHIRWEIEVYRCGIEPSPVHAGQAPELPAHYQWIGPEDMPYYAFPNVFLRILNQYFASESGEGQSSS